MPVAIAAFYRFVDLSDFRELREPIRALAASLGIKGTILLAEEGINSTIAGPHESIDPFFNEIGTMEPRLANLERKLSRAAETPFKRLKVRLKKEIVRMKAVAANPALGVGKYVDPADWNAVIQDPETVVIDVRNSYELAVGTFEGAVDPETSEFWEFPKFVETNLPDKSRPIAMFCTGGIRCERATAYMVQHGYENVMHLRGGILNYLEKVPEAESLWHGACFVFDERGAVDHALAPFTIDE